VAGKVDEICGGPERSNFIHKQSLEDFPWL
jgi:hypothetical protein